MIRLLTLLALALPLFGLPDLVYADLGPENCVLVVNADNPDSVTVARQYTDLRRLPPCNVIELSGLPAKPVITVADFRALVLQPVLDAIRRRGLEPQIDAIIYSCGFPYAVDVREDMAGKQFPRVITQPASLTGLTYLADLVLAKDTAYLSLDANWYTRPLKRQQPPVAYSPLEEPLAVRLQVLLEQYQAARRKAQQEKAEVTPESAQWLAEATKILQTLIANHQASPELLYDLSCVLALQGKSDDAMATLTEAYRAGWWNALLTERDPDLKSLREREDFKALIAEMRRIIVESEPPVPFHRATGWMPDGRMITLPEGRHYYLSAMLGYIGEKANTLEEVQRCLSIAATADGTRPAGTIYCMTSTDWARTGPRQWAFNSVVEALAKLGVKGEVLNGVLPPGKPDVAGAVVGIAGFKWLDSGSKILPGAFCDHLTSFAGVMTGTGQTMLSEWIRYGAAGASGTVTEPYALPAKFPSAFLHVYYASGCTLAEAFYQSLKGPYQQLLVGDPLCRPWAKIPEVKVKGLKPGETIKKPRKLTVSVSGDERPVAYELYVNGVFAGRSAGFPARAVTLDPKTLAAGQHEARVVALVGSLETRGEAVVPFRVP
ncbi:MAG: hypothetical protein KKI08_05675 [Armatimonadetes bacterium]|nr:hypothetical protein [Armatimonadota bacterium]